MNYKGIEENADGVDQVRGFVTQDFVKELDTWEECCEFLDGDVPILSKIGCISRMRGYDEAQAHPGQQTV